jgi:D-aminopeptidase
MGGGTGMGCGEFKGGIGTSSRVVPEEAGGFTVGVLVMSNFGRRENLVVDGVPVGRELRDWEPPPSVVHPDLLGSSIIIVLATDAPVDTRQLERLSMRAGPGQDWRVALDVQRGLRDRLFDGQPRAALPGCPGAPARPGG